MAIAELTRRGFLEALVAVRAIRAELTATLRASDYAAYAFETPVYSATTADRPAQFVLTEVRALAHVEPDPAPFATQLRDADRIATFANLGRDATLVVPSPRAVANAAHLAAFVRTADDALIDELWIAVGGAALARAVDRPVWVGTAGLGVSWLHVRIDDAPKYYRHARFADPAY